MSNNDNNKAILLVRVSTKKQDFDEQERELYQLALADGYTDNNIIAICEKESGIKLREEERRGLNQMKEVISAGNVSCVYAWEPSRIARKKKVLFSITEYLTERRIQLIIKEPHIKLLNPDGSINDGAETVLTLFGQLAESEMRNKQARWTRTRIANSKAGVWNGGSSIRYGYTIDDKKRYVIDEEQGEIVKLVYELYTTTNMGQTHLQNELKRRGIELSQDRIRRMLSFRGYTGQPIRSPYYMNGEKKDGHELRYPAIISEEIFDKAQLKKENANNMAHKGRNYYFAKGLLRCPACGHTYIAYKHSALYMCVAYKHDNKDIEKCHHNVCININVLDTLLWDATVSEYIKARAADTDYSKAEYEKQIEVCKKIISAAEKRIEKTQKSKKRYAIIYAEGNIDEDDYTKAKAKVDTEIAEINREVTSAEEKISQYQKMLNATEQPNFVDIIRSLSETAFGYNELREMSELVHTYINKVDIEQTNRCGSRTKEVTITATDGTVYEYCARYARKHHYWKREPQLSEHINEYREIMPEIIINRRLGRTCSKDKSTPEVAIIRNHGEYYIDDVKPVAVKEFSESLSNK